MNNSVTEQLESLEALCGKSGKEFTVVRKQLQEGLRKISPELAEDDPFLALITSYVLLRNGCNQIIAAVPDTPSSLEDSFPLTRLQIVEIETRVQFVHAHILRIMAEQDGKERHELVVSGITSLFEFLPDISRCLAELGLLAGREGCQTLSAALDRSNLDFQKLLSEITDVFEKNNLDAMLIGKMGLEV
jgi:hypothetical protein